MLLNETFQLRKAINTKGNIVFIKTKGKENDRERYIDLAIQSNFNNTRDKKTYLPLFPGMDSDVIRNKYLGNYDYQHKYWYWDLDLISEDLTKETGKNVTPQDVYDNYVYPCYVQLNKLSLFYAKNSDISPKELKQKQNIWDNNDIEDSEISKLDKSYPEHFSRESIIELNTAENALEDACEEIPWTDEKGNKMTPPPDKSLEIYENLKNDLLSVVGSEEYLKKLEYYMNWGEEHGLGNYSITNILLAKAQLQARGIQDGWIAPESDWDKVTHRRIKENAQPIWLNVRGGEFADNLKGRIENIKNDESYIDTPVIQGFALERAKRERKGNYYALMPYFYVIYDTEPKPGWRDLRPEYQNNLSANSNTNSKTTPESKRYFIATLQFLKDKKYISTEQENGILKLLNDEQKECVNIINDNGNLQNVNSNEINNAKSKLHEIPYIRTFGLIYNYATHLMLNKYDTSMHYRKKEDTKKLAELNDITEKKANICAWTVMKMLHINDIPESLNNLAKSQIDTKNAEKLFNNTFSISSEIFCGIRDKLKDLYFGGTSKYALRAVGNDGQKGEAPKGRRKALEESINSDADIARLFGYGDLYEKRILSESKEIKNDFFDIYNRIW